VPKTRQPYALQRLDLSGEPFAENDPRVTASSAPLSDIEQSSAFLYRVFAL
jgi:hypothetical protein